MFSESASPSMSGDERMSRSDEVFLLLVDIPVDVGPVLERGYDPDRVAEAIKKFDRFSNEDLSIGIRKYWQHDGSDDDAELVASELVTMFKGLFRDSWGEWLEYLLKNTILTVLSARNVPVSLVSS